MTKPRKAHDGHAGMFRHKIGSGHFEVFWSDDIRDDENVPVAAGWFWWTCEPGCLPDSSAFGPFNTSRQAWLDARSE